MQNLRSLATDRFPGAPSSIRGTDQHQELKQHPDYLAACAEWENLKKDNASKALIEKARSKKKMIIEKLRRSATQIVRAEWMETEGLRYLRKSLAHESDRITNKRNSRPVTGKEGGIILLPPGDVHRSRWCILLYL